MPDAVTDSADPVTPPRWPGSASTPRLTPTGPGDYAVLNGAFMGGVSLLLIGASRRAAHGQDPIGQDEIPLLALATFALAQVIAKDKVATWLREPFVEETGDHRPSRPEGSGLRYAVGELMTCTRCLGAWGALSLVSLRTLSPPAGRAATALLATAGANNFLQGSFRLLSEKADCAEAEAATAARA
jgi:hypothetical protein